jgi:lethal(2) giant larvae protein
MICIRSSATSPSATLWAGTNTGQILVFLLSIASGEKRKKEKATGMLAKEIQLKHRAPVIAIEVVDGKGAVVRESTADSSASNAEVSSGHKVLIASEEQLKTFLLPTLKPCIKYKLTAHEGARIRRIGMANFVSRSEPEYSENCFVCLTNQGDISVHGLPELRRQIQTNCIKKEDVIAVSTLVFTQKGTSFTALD